MRETIVIIDYRQSLRRLYDLELSDEGYEILPAENEEEALRMLKNRCPDLVIIDGEVLLSGGIDTLERIKNFCGRTLIVVNDANASTCEKLMGLPLVDDCIIKSSDLDQLRLKIRQVLLQKGEA